MAYIKNPKGIVTTVTDEHKEYLLAKVKYETNSNGKKIPVPITLAEMGYTEPTPSEIKAYKERFETIAEPAKEEVKKVEVVEEKEEEKPVKLSKKEKKAKALEEEVRAAQGDMEKYDDLSDEGKELYIELFETTPDVA